MRFTAIQKAFFKGQQIGPGDPVDLQLEDCKIVGGNPVLPSWVKLDDFVPAVYDDAAAAVDRKRASLAEVVEHIVSAYRIERSVAQAEVEGRLDTLAGEKAAVAAQAAADEAAAKQAQKDK